jgi:agarase
MRALIRLALLATILPLATNLSWAAAAPSAKTNQFFHAEKVNGRWWLISPDGHRFISKGVTTVQLAADVIQGTDNSPYLETNKVKYGNPIAWRKAVATRLISWGFNSLGAWSDEAVSEVAVENQRLAYTPIIDLGANFVREKQKGAAWLHGIFPDVFDPDFEPMAHQLARERCTPRAGDRWLLGWFTDNELRWGPDWRGADELLTMFLALPASVPGKKAAVDLMRERYGDVKKFNAVWNTTFASWDELSRTNSIHAPVVRKAIYAQNEETERQANEADPKRAAFVADCEVFLTRLAERYFRVTSEAIRAADPNHMNFGCRFAYVPPQPVIAAVAKYVDAISFNCYRLDPREVINRYSAFGKPLIIGEFSFRSADSGLPNTKGAGPKVNTQAERAAAFKNYVTLALQNPNLVGYHWFEHCDQPKEGRFDGENSNYGVVNIRDEVYEDLTRAMTEINAKAETLHEGVAESK